MGGKKHVNRRKVGQSIWRYRVVCVLAVLCNALLVYAVASLIFTATQIALMVIFCGAFVLGAVCGIPNLDISTPAHGTKPIDVSCYGWIVELWRVRCLRYGAVPGPVFMIEGEYKGGMKLSNFNVDNVGLIRMHPVLYVGAAMVPLLHPWIVEPIIEHELGHCRLSTPLFRYFLQVVTTPGTSVLSLFCIWRRLFEQRFPVIARCFWLMERLFFWASHYAIRQYEEYTADAFMTEAVRDEERLVDMLRCMEKHITWLGGCPLSPEDAHLVSHPSTEERIRAIRLLFD